jgi:hypothetical protein
MFASSQKTARDLFKHLKGAKAKDNETGEEIPLISIAQSEQIRNKLKTRQQQNEARIASIQMQINKSKDSLS